MLHTTSLPSVLPASPAAAGIARRSTAAVGAGASFADFLSDKQGKGSPPTTDDQADAAAPAKLKAARNAANDADAAPPAPATMAALTPFPATSAYQVVLTPTPSMGGEASSPAADDDSTRETAAVPSQDPRARPPLIRPHGPPPTDGQDDSPDTEPVAAGAAPPTTTPPKPSVSLPLTAVDANLQAAATVVPGTPKAAVPAIEPHDPPAVPPDDPGSPKPALTAGPGKEINPLPIVSPIDPHGPPVPVDDPAPALPVPTIGTSKRVAASPIDPHGPPMQPDDPVAPPSLPTSGSAKGAVIPSIAPHGPPVQAGDTIPITPLFTSSPGKGFNTSPIDPHGPPVQLDDPLPPGPVSPVGMGKREYTTILPAPANPPADLAPQTLNPPASMAKGEFTTTLPTSPDNSQDATGTGVPVPASINATPVGGSAPVPAPVYLAPAAVEITTSMQARVPVPAVAITAISPTKAEPSPAPADGDEATDLPSVFIPGSANLAAQTLRSAARAVAPTGAPSTQVFTPEQLTRTLNHLGTPVAKEEAAVTATATIPEATIDRSNLLRRGAAMPPVSTLTGQAVAITGTSKTVTALPSLATSAAPDAPATAPLATTANPALTMDHVQTLLQTVLDAGVKTGANGSSQMEMHVRLDGGTNDVTVQLQMTDNRMHVTFQTDSPELRQALERGWSDFTAHAAVQSSPVAVASPNFVPPAASRAQTTADFSGGQQNAPRQDAPPTPEDALPSSGSVWHGSRFVTSPGSEPAGVSDRSTSRWTGWA